MNSYILVFGTLALVVILIAWVVLALKALRRGESEADKAWTKLETVLADRFDVVSQVVEYSKTDVGNTKLQESAKRAMNAYARAYQNQDPQQAGHAEMVFAKETMPLLAASIKENNAMTATSEIRRGIAKTGDEISKVRRMYNEVALRFNSAISQIPTNIIANTLKIQERTTFLDPTEANARMVNLRFE